MLAPAPLTALTANAFRLRDRPMSDQNAQLIAWLEDQGHTEAEIDKILAKVAEYDDRTVHEAIFDSIDSGNLNLAKLVKDALAKED